jgi:hypothetical protein
MRSLFLVAALAASVANFPASACDFGGVELVRAELLFGRSAVTAAEWEDFLAHSVTPRFPDGLTVLDGQGQWLSPNSGRISHEASTVLLILATPAPDLKARLDAVREDYKTRFHQQSVGLITSPSCAEF